MANTSILSAFERMWQHILVKLNKSAGLKTEGMTYTDANGNTYDCKGEVFNNYVENVILNADGNPKDGNVASGTYSHAEGTCTMASGSYSHAEGTYAMASGVGSHAEGYKTKASGGYSHAEGNRTESSGYLSHAEGSNTIASGDTSHAEGSKTIASGNCSHVQGKYNIEDTENRYSHIVGNGDDEEASNAHTLDWDGNAWFAGNVYVGGNNQDEGSQLATKEYVDSLFASIAEIKNYLGI